MSADCDSEYYHLHKYTEARDCDGIHYYDCLIQLSDMLTPMEGHVFRNYWIGSIVQLWEPEGKLCVVCADGVSWHTRTDEGFESTEILFCDNQDCLPETHDQRMDRMMAEYAEWEEENCN